MKPVRLRKAACVYGKVEGRFIQRDRRRLVWNRLGRIMDIFFPKIGLSVRLKILSIWIAAPR